MSIQTEAIRSHKSFEFLQPRSSLPLSLWLRLPCRAFPSGGRELRQIRDSPSLPLHHSHHSHPAGSWASLSSWFPLQHSHHSHPAPDFIGHQHLMNNPKGKCSLKSLRPLIALETRLSQQNQLIFLNLCNFLTPCRIINITVSLTLISWLSQNISSITLPFTSYNPLADIPVEPV